MIQNRHFRLTARTVAALAVLLAIPAFAQQDRWWRVELLIFSHESAQPTEQWEPTPDLAYPSAAHFLVEPGRVEDNLAQYHADSEVDKSVPDQIALLPRPFVTLPGTQLEFRGKAAYMQRSGKYQTLFHRTWVQPVVDQASALPIILDRSGDTGQWPRLQGSIKLYLSRYLHLETNLWLNTPGDYLPGVWRMPPPPLGPPSLIIEALPEPESLTGDWASEPEPTSLPEGAGELTVTDEELGPVYPYRHAVLLQQERRMRSTEVHYIDHPMLGVVAKLTPLTAADLEAMAQAEAGGNQPP